MAGPIDQFHITPYIPFEMGGVDLSFTNSSMWMTLAVGFSMIFFTIAMQKKSLVPGRLQMCSEMMYEFVASMIRENIGNEGRKYFPLVFTVFMVVLVGNMFGMIPGSFTYTSHIIVTAIMAFAIFFLVIALGLFRHGFHFFNLFIPPGVPAPMLLVLVPIELMSFLVRPITLSVRLFANMMAGHIVLKVFAGFSVTLVGIGGFGYVAGILPVIFNVAIIALEFLIAFLQAYVFALLTCIYLKDTIEIHH